MKRTLEAMRETMGVSMIRKGRGHKSGRRDRADGAISGGMPTTVIYAPAGGFPILDRLFAGCLMRATKLL
jgi:hypothetical protein